METKLHQSGRFSIFAVRYGSVVQWIEYQIPVLRVGGSSPFGVTQNRVFLPVYFFSHVNHIVLNICFVIIYKLRKKIIHLSCVQFPKNTIIAVKIFNPTIIR